MNFGRSRNQSVTFIEIVTILAETAFVKQQPGHFARVFFYNNLKYHICIMLKAKKKKKRQIVYFCLPRVNNIYVYDVVGNTKMIIVFYEYQNVAIITNQ